MVLVKLERNMQKNDKRLLLVLTYKNYLKMDQRPKTSPWNNKLHGTWALNLQTLALEKIYEFDPKDKESKGKNKWMGLYQTKKIVHSKSNHQQNKTKRPPTEWGKIFAINSSDKDIIFKIYKEPMQLNTKHTKQFN